jgi:hypothetical protein
MFDIDQLATATSVSFSLLPAAAFSAVFLSAPPYNCLHWPSPSGAAHATPACRSLGSHSLHRIARLVLFLFQSVFPLGGLFALLLILLQLTMHISDKLAEAKKAGKVSFSFEFFPPKTAQVRHTL